MKKLTIAIAMLVGIAFSSQAQKNINIGAGYFGQFLTYPGVVLEFESEQMFTEKASLPLRVDLGYYSHARNHNGLFMDVNYGYRRYFDSGIFLEESIGIGVLKTSLNTDDAYEVADDGSVSEVSKGIPADLMPSVTLGLGYKFKGAGGANRIWMRPKMYWQFPYKRSAIYHVAMQVGFSHTFGK